MKTTAQEYETTYGKFDKNELATFKHDVDNECGFIDVVDKIQALDFISVLETRIQELEEQLKVGEDYFDLLAMNRVANDRIKELETALVTSRDEHARSVQELTRHIEASKPKWISVKDRLPKELQHVLVYYGGLHYAVTYYGEADCFGVSGSTKFHPRVINYWMPLPPPPNEEISAIDMEGKQADGSKSQDENVKTAENSVVNESLAKKYEEFLSRQKSLDSDSRQLLEENLWDLVENPKQDK